ncbi:MAG: ribosome maturation factor RimM [Desulfobacterota bacterium]|nr:ribosome maturation factor RimM [Thermodesulfobacteriota bacterium]MDW8001517.1 ribosome maturation factor RimM [Deltaproteobacteria bacterium]
MSLYIPVGKVLSAHGIKGEVKFLYYNEVYEEFKRYTSLYYGSAGQKVKLTVERVKFREGRFIIKFQEISDRTSAEALKGKILEVKEEDLPPLREDEYYEYQIIGSLVKNEEGRILGEVKEIIHTGANPVLVIGKETEILIPMVEDFVRAIDTKAKTVIVKEPEYI